MGWERSLSVLRKGMFELVGESDRRFSGQTFIIAGHHYCGAERGMGRI